MVRVRPSVRPVCFFEPSPVSPSPSFAVSPARVLVLLFRMRIEQLQTYRQKGITTLAEGAMYEAHKRKAQEGVRTMACAQHFSCLVGGGGGT